MNNQLAIKKTTWSGNALDYMITRAICDTDTVIKAGINVIDGIRRKLVIPRVNASASTIGGRIIEPKTFEIYHEFNPSDFEIHFVGEFEHIPNTLPMTVENYLMLQYIKKLNVEIETAIWNSRKTFDGIIYKALADPEVLMLSPVEYDKTNIRQNVLMPMLEVLMQNPYSKALVYKYGPLGLRYFVSYSGNDIYTEALKTDDRYKSDSTITPTGIKRFKGHDIVPLAGLNKGSMLLTVGRPDIQSNLWLGVNTTDDVELVLEETKKPGIWCIRGLIRIDVNYASADSMVLFTDMKL